MAAMRSPYFQTQPRGSSVCAVGRAVGKVVVVTGAARGQGAAEAAALVREGATVIATDVLDADGEQLAAKVPGSLTYRHLDVTDAAGWTALAQDLMSTHGVVHGLVNNAGISSRDRIPDVDLDRWNHAFAVNVTGPLLGIQALVPLMTAGGSIVNVCSVAAMAGHVAAAYTASKWALRGLTRTCSLELATRSIRTNAIMPGLIDTPLMDSASPAFSAAAIAEVPLARMGVVDDVAPLVVYLISDESTYVNGAEIAVDGGLTAHVSHKRIADAIRPVT